MLLKDIIYKNKCELLLHAIALSWWKNKLELIDKIALQKKWFRNKTMYSLTNDEILKIWECEHP